MTVVLVAGPQWVGPNYFAHFYVPLLDAAIAAGERFVLGDADGVDQMAQAYLAARVDPQHVTVYVKHGKLPRLAHSAFNRDDQSTSYPNRDARMASICTRTIVVLPQFGGGTGGTLVPLLCHQLQAEKQDSVEACVTTLTVTTIIRKFSEPADVDLTNVVSALYELWYAPDREACARARAELDRKLSLHE